ncbi:hypothetical protein [Streptomyces sp. AC555_RSS877]|nr:hypothetical protein [Streptomyces sp. AC555_RSS877]
MTTWTVGGDRWYLLHEGHRTGPGELERKTVGGRAGVLAYGCAHLS